jgi:hypothetical protein
MKHLIYLLIIFFSLESKAQNNICIANNPIVLNDINNYQVFFLGENHGISIEPVLYYDFLTYLYKNANVRNLVMERGTTEALFINEYLKTGDENYIAHETFEENITFLRKLYAFNQNLATEGKINVIGVDYERISLLNKTFNLFQQKDQLPTNPITEVKTLFASLKDYEEVPKVMSKVRKIIAANEQDFKTYFGSNFHHIKNMVENNAFYARESQRNNEFHKNFLAVSQTKIKGNFFVTMGTNHTNLKFNFSFAKMLNYEEKSPFFNKVMAINIHYDSCFSNYDNQISLVEQSSLHRWASKSQFIKIKEYVKKANCDVLLIEIGSSFESKLREYGQYILYVRKQKAMTIIKK